MGVLYCNWCDREVPEDFNEYAECKDTNKIICMRCFEENFLDAYYNDEEIQNEEEK